LTNIGAGEIIYDLRKKIQEIQVELEQLGEPTKSIPEMIESANLLRSNEYLSKSNEKKSALIDAYSQYSISLEELLTTVFDIQKDLKDILKKQSALIPNSSKKPLKSKSKKK
jgi:predicted  nucleic acid-binding Zn-ribbon protein